MYNYRFAILSRTAFDDHKCAILWVGRLRAKHDQKMCMYAFYLF